MKSPAIFYRITSPHVKRGHTLMIPDEFAKVHGHELSTTAKLTVPGGPSWEVGLKKSGKELWFCDGWKEFAEHHAIHGRFFLLFEYEGNSKFNVHIFGLPGSEISYYPRNHGDDSVEILSSLGSEPPVISSPQQVSCEPIYKKATGDRCSTSFLQKSSKFAPECSTRIKTREIHFSSMESMRSGLGYDTRNKRRMLDDGEEITKSDNLTATCRGKKKKGESKNVENLRTDTKRVHVELATHNEDEQQTTVKNEELEESVVSKFMKSQLVTTSGRKIAINGNMNFEPENASFTVVLQQYQFKYGPVHVPVPFIKRYLKISSDTIINLTFGGKQWRVLFIYSKGIHCLSRGWSTFAEDNQLSAGNTCVFKLIEVKNITFKVSIFRGGDSLLKNRPEFASESSMRTKTHGSHFSSMERLRSKRGNFTRNNPTERAAEDGHYLIEDGKQPRVKNEEVELPVSKMSKSKLVTTPEGKIAINDAKNFKQRNPSFTVVLLSYNIKRGPIVNVSVQFIRKYLNLSSDATILLTCGGRQWEVLLIYSNGTHCLSRGWSAFVKDNQLSVGDICVFELVEVQNITFKVSISRGGDKQKDLENLCTERTHRSVEQQERVKSELVTIPERKQAIHEAMMFKPRNPYFVVSLRPFNVKPKYLVNVPVAFIKKYLNISSTATTVLLAVGGRQWEVVLFHDKRSHCLRRGWLTFVNENHLSEGDACVFELIQVKNIIIFKVFIFRAGEGSA